MHDSQIIIVQCGGRQNTNPKSTDLSPVDYTNKDLGLNIIHQGFVSSLLDKYFWNPNVLLTY